MFLVETEEIITKKDRFVATIHTNVAKTPAVFTGNHSATSRIEIVVKEPRDRSKKHFIGNGGTMSSFRGLVKKITTTCHKIVAGSNGATSSF